MPDRRGHPTARAGKIRNSGSVILISLRARLTKPTATFAEHVDLSQNTHLSSLSLRMAWPTDPSLSMPLLASILAQIRSPIDELTLDMSIAPRIPTHGHHRNGLVKISTVLLRSQFEQMKTLSIGWSGGLSRAERKDLRIVFSRWLESGVLRLLASI